MTRTERQLQAGLFALSFVLGGFVAWDRLAFAEPQADPSAIDAGSALADALLDGWHPSGLPRLAILPPEASAGLPHGAGEEIARGLSVRWSGLAVVKVLAQDRVDAVLAEQREQLSDIYAASTRSALGALEGASHLVFTRWDFSGDRLVLDGEVVAVGSGARERAAHVELMVGPRILSALGGAGASASLAIARLFPDAAARPVAVVLPLADLGDRWSALGAAGGRWLETRLQDRVTLLAYQEFAAGMERLGLDPAAPPDAAARRRVGKMFPDLCCVVGGSLERSGAGWRAGVESRLVAEGTVRRAEVILPADAFGTELVAGSEASSALLQGLREGATEHPLGLRVGTPRGERPVYFAGERLQIDIGGQGWVWLYVYDIRPDGSAVRLFPNAYAPDPCVQLDRGVHLPPDGQSSWVLEIQPPFGTDVVYAVASDRAFHPKAEEALVGAAIDWRAAKTRGIGVVASEGGAAASQGRCDPRSAGGVVDEAVLAVVTRPSGP